QHFARPHRWRRLCGGRGGFVFDVFLSAANANEPLHAIIPGREIVIAERPVDAEAVPALALEVIGSEPKGDASPMVGPAADHPGAIPAKAGTLGRGVRLARDLPSAPGGGVKIAEWLVRRGRPPQRRLF